MEHLVHIVLTVGLGLAYLGLVIGFCCVFEEVLLAMIVLGGFSFLTYVVGSILLHFLGSLTP